MKTEKSNAQIKTSKEEPTKQNPTKSETEQLFVSLFQATLIVASFTVIIRMCKFMVRDIKDMNL
jgi:hypothetical protein